VAITRHTLRLSRELRLVVTDLADQATRQLVAAWVKAWDELDTEMADAVDDLLEVGAGEWPTLQQIRRATRAQKALEHATIQLRALSEKTGVLVVEQGGQAAAAGAEFQARLIASQMPPSAGDMATLSATFDRVSPAAIDAIVRRITGQVYALSRPLTAEATGAMERALVRGVAVGSSPRVAARNMLTNLEGGFNGGLTRALTIARTEILDAHRVGAQAGQQANADVLTGWVWLAQLDKRTCPSCWGQNGTEHDLDDPGPNDHQNGRCARMPKAKSWARLGFHGIDEPPDLLPDARKVFDGLSKADQLAVMGPGRLAALQDGSLSWDGLSRRVQTVGWRDSYATAPLGEPRYRHLSGVR
jgi:hypothetical protein